MLVGGETGGKELGGRAQNCGSLASSCRAGRAAHRGDPACHWMGPDVGGPPVPLGGRRERWRPAAGKGYSRGGISPHAGPPPGRGQEPLPDLMAPQVPRQCQMSPGAGAGGSHPLEAHCIKGKLAPCSIFFASRLAGRRSVYLKDRNGWQSGQNGKWGQGWPARGSAPICPTGRPIGCAPTSGGKEWGARLRHCPPPANTPSLTPPEAWKGPGHGTC